MIIFDEDFDMVKEVTKVVITEKNAIREIEAYADDSSLLFILKWKDERKIKLSLVDDEYEQK
ncbi:MAG: hypothetical protein V3V84_00615 [Candidatus Bathyarchaeia archaeon]